MSKVLICDREEVEGPHTQMDCLPLVSKEISSMVKCRWVSTLNKKKTKQFSPHYFSVKEVESLRVKKKEGCTSSHLSREEKVQLMESMG